MKNLNEKIEKIRTAISISTLPRNRYKNRPIGCPMKRMCAAELRAAFTTEELHHAFALGLIGNNGHDGSIIKNAKDLKKL